MNEQVHSSTIRIVSDYAAISLDNDRIDRIRCPLNSGNEAKCLQCFVINNKKCKTLFFQSSNSSQLHLATVQRTME